MLHQEHINIFNTDIHAVTQTQVLTLVESAIDTGEKLRLGMVNGAKIVNMQNDALLREDVGSSDLVLADGMSIVWASALLGKHLPERITGIDLMFRFLELANRRHFRVYCLGATPEVSSTVADNIRRDYPGLVLAGHYHGYFDDEQAADLANDIAQREPDILLVAMTSPRKERFMAVWDDVMHVPIVHGVGGSFDVYAGAIKRAPLFWQKAGLEWLYRVWQEPGRLWKRYATTNSQFLFMLAGALLHRGAHVFDSHTDRK